MLSLHEAFTTPLQEVAEPPSVDHFLDLLKECRKKKNLAYARQVHTHLQFNGLGAHDVFGSHLVLLFVQCGSLQSALQAFHRLAHRNIFTWNCLLEGYIEHGDFQHTLNLHHKMQDDCVETNRYTLQVLLKACAKLKCVERGQEIHLEVAREGLEEHPFISSTLVDMYVKCGSLVDALDVLESFPSRDVVSWTALMSGYADNGLGKEVLKCLEQMQLEGISPNTVTFVCSLKGCGSIESVEKGQELHAGIVKLGLEEDPIVINALIDMYMKCALLQEAQNIFDALPYPCVIAWTALISGYAEHGCSEEVFNLTEKMKADGVSPNIVTIVCCLKGCGSKGNSIWGRRVHIDVLKYGFEGDMFVGSVLIDVYAKCGFLASALLVFEMLPARNVVCWNALIAGYAEYGLAGDVWNFVEIMVSEGVSLDLTTFSSIVKACNKQETLDMGWAAHCEIVKEGLESHPVVGSALVDMYTNCGSPEEAQEVFDELPTREVVTWTALISGYAEHELGEEVLGCYEQMQAEGILANSFTFVGVIKACGCEGAIERGQEIHAEIIRKGLEQSSFIGSALVDMYAKFSMLEDAQGVFEGMLVKNVVLWSAWIAGCARGGGSMCGIEMFERMIREGVQPEDLTFSSILAICSHEGLVDEGLMYFESMITEYGIVPSIEHNNCLVDLLGRAGQLSLAVAFLKSTPESPTLITWNILLGACRKWRGVKLGREVLECAMRSNEAEPATFYLMSSIYADAGMWAESKDIDALRAEYACP